MAALQQVQRAAGNQATLALLQREEAEEDEAEADGEGLSGEAADRFVTLMEHMSDQELDRAATELGGQVDQGEQGESEASEAGGTGGPDVVIQRSVATIRRVKQKQTQISSDTAPNLGLAGRLEKNHSRKARLVAFARWKKIKAKHAKTNFRKYAAIRHRNLQGDVTTDDLVLVIRLSAKTPIGSALDRHYAAIEAKSNQKRQTAQHRTELLGEVVASRRMESYLNSGCELLIGYASGAGIDQLWVNHSKKIYYVVEAKGPGAKLTQNRFAVRGAQNGSLTQMSKAWIADRIPRIRTQYPALLTQLLNDCGMKVSTKGALVRDPVKPATYKLCGLTISAQWDETNDDTASSMTKPNYF